MKPTVKKNMPPGVVGKKDNKKKPALITDPSKVLGNLKVVKPIKVDPNLANMD